MRLRCLQSLLPLLLLSTAAQANGSDFSLEASAPPGFSEIAKPREALLDLYFGVRKVGEAMVVISPGSIRFREPDAVAALLPATIAPVRISEILASELPANSALACAKTNADRCGRLSPEIVGVIFDEDRFRLDLFVNPDLLPKSLPDEPVYLEAPTAAPSLTSSVGLAVSGSSETSPAYNLQNRTIIGVGKARVRADSAYASKLGLVVDTLVAELDDREWRYSAGLFWSSGVDLIGQRRILGVGMETQFDTRADRDELEGTPLILFLSQPARVEILRDGRLVSSQAHDAGNTRLDTAGLPDGSYPLVLRIIEPGGSVREEQRFFVKNPQIAPVGQSLYFGYVGLLANTRRDRAVSLSDSLYYQVGTARRLSNSLAVDVSLLGTQDKALVELGGWLITPGIRARGAALASTAGDVGGLLQLGSSGFAPLNFTFDFRRIWSRDDRPLIPLPTYVDSFGTAPIPGLQGASGSYTQATGSIGYRLGAAYLSVIGSLRKDEGRPADYSIGPAVSWPVLNHRGLQLTFHADAQRTSTTTASYAGFRLLFNKGPASIYSSAGRASVSDSTGRSRSRAVTSLQGQYSLSDEQNTQAMLGAGLERSLDSTSIRADGSVYSRYGNARGDILHALQGQGGTHYGIMLQTSAAATGTAAALGGRDLDETALIITLDGPPPARFEVLIDDAPRGRVTGGERLSLSLPAYRAYGVRLRPVAATAVQVDAGVREVTLYPGSVAHLRWRAQSYVTVFGQAVDRDGAPIANAMVQSTRGVGQTDATGYFQIDAGGGERLAFSMSGKTDCVVRLGDLSPTNDYVSVGKVVCQ